MLSLMPMVFIAADLFWCPVRVRLALGSHLALGVMMVFDRPKGDRLHE